VNSKQNKSLLFLDEPLLAFGHGQVLENPKDGLLLFGPLSDNRSPAELRVGVVGRSDGISRYKRWTRLINNYIPAERKDASHHYAYPGFEAIFSCVWPIQPISELPIPDEKIFENLYLDDKHDAIYKTVGLICFDLSID